MTVLETPFFIRKAAGLLTDGERERMIAFVGANPEIGDVVRILSSFPFERVREESESQLNQGRTERVEIAGSSAC